MGVPDDADLLDTYNTSEFGATLSFGGTSITGLWLNDYAEVLEVQGSTPIFKCRTSDVTAIAIDTSVTGAPGGGTYLLKVKRPMTWGETICEMELQ